MFTQQAAATLSMRDALRSLVESIRNGEESDGAIDNFSNSFEAMVTNCAAGINHRGPMRLTAPLPQSTPVASETPITYARERYSIVNAPMISVNELARYDATTNLFRGGAAGAFLGPVFIHVGQVKAGVNQQNIGGAAVGGPVGVDQLGLVMNGNAHVNKLRAVDNVEAGGKVKSTGDLETTNGNVVLPSGGLIDVNGTTYDPTEIGASTIVERSASFTHTDFLAAAPSFDWDTGLDLAAGEVVLAAFFDLDTVFDSTTDPGVSWLLDVGHQFTRTAIINSADVDAAASTGKRGGGAVNYADDDTGGKQDLSVTIKDGGAAVDTDKLTQGAGQVHFLIWTSPS